MIQQFHEFFELGPIVRRILKKSITTKFEWVTTNMLFSNFLQREDIFLGLLLVTTALTTATSPFNLSDFYDFFKDYVDLHNFRFRLPALYIQNS